MNKQRQWRLADILITAYFCVSLGLNNGFILGGLTVFDGGFLEALDISAAQLKLRDSITLAIVGVFALITGGLVDKFGALRVLIIGHGLFTLAFLILSQAASLEIIYLAQAILGLCQLCSGYLVCVIAVSRILKAGTGLAIGLMMASTSLANAALPAFNEMLISRFGPEGALLAIALMGLPLMAGAALLTRVHMAASPTAQDNDQQQDGPTLSDALKRIDFWALVIIACVSFFSFLGLITNLYLYANSEPLSAPEATAAFFFAVFIASLIAQTSAGWLADRMSMRPLHVPGLILMAGAAAALAAAQTVSAARLALLAMGLGWGLNYVLVQIAIPSRFAGAHLGRIFGSIVIAEALAGAAGPAVFARGLDVNGDYALIFTISAGLLLIGAVAAFILYRPRAT